MSDINVLDVGRIHFHECSVLQENGCNPFCYLDREFAICIKFLALRRALHQRCRGRFESGKEALFMERKQGFDTTEDNFPLRCGDDSFFAGTNPTDEVDWSGTGFHIYVDELLQSFDISPFSPFWDVSFTSEISNLNILYDLSNDEGPFPLIVLVFSLFGGTTAIGSCDTNGL